MGDHNGYAKSFFDPRSHAKGREEHQRSIGFFAQLRGPARISRTLFP